MRTAVLSFGYPIERSPTVKGIIEYLVKRGFEPDVILESANHHLLAELPTSRVVQLLPRWVLWVRARVMSAAAVLQGAPVIGRGAFRRIRSFLDAVMWWPAAYRLRRIGQTYDLVYCIEAGSLFLIDAAKIPLGRCIYVSLELQQIISVYGCRKAGELLAKCAVRLVQSPERALLLNKALGRVLEYQYLPVSTVPYAPTRRCQSNGGPIRLVYSGYIARWSHLKEFLLAYRDVEREMPVTLTVHGHSYGTGEYLREILALLADLPTARFEERPMSEREHQEFLEDFDVGVALYQPVAGNDNWKGLLKSSGKIAAYLWSGLAVLTNLADEDTRNVPFLFTDQLTHGAVRDALRAYQLSRDSCVSLALRYATEHYNIYTYLDALHRQIDESGLSVRLRARTESS